MSEHAEHAQALADVEDFTERLSTTFDTCYTWSYDTFKVGLRNLYEKAKQNQWDSATALAWDTDVDPEAENLPDANNPLWGSAMWAKFTPAEVRKFRREQLSWSLSQFLHGEQGALLATAQIVDAAPTMDAKLYAAAQVFDLSQLPGSELASKPMRTAALRTAVRRLLAAAKPPGSSGG